ncbi:sugar kinase [Streptomyces gibsoniae]|uniref:Sugar kinase n=1 Tax=Streptomyces gibsoniae TaxID=3075529 RepID=A0ABU2TQ14_9ACTN|nr:sugar kinase [Streptomyces sp. DSM 41699]MDT0462931.1 sugar kinase [Streptomyces sp. DSM 41699]
MTATVSIPRQSSPPDEPSRPPEGGWHKFRRRALTLLIIGLLIGVPAGYLVISANQSRNSGKDKEAKYSATGLTEGWPSRVQRRLYDVWIPWDATDVTSYETNNWKTSRLYVQFSTSDDGLNRFLSTLKATPSSLKKDDLAIGERDRHVVDWAFTGPGPWSGLTHARKNPAPTLDVVVNRTDPQHPTVYVVSRTIP